MTETHVRGGNCWCSEEIYHGGCPLGADTKPDAFCDQCHEHSAPRGQCSSCSRCALCDHESSAERGTSMRRKLGGAAIDKLPSGAMNYSGTYCPHDLYEVHVPKRVVVCKRCKATVDAFTVLERMSRREDLQRQRAQEARDLSKHIAALKVEEKRVKARTRGARRKDADAARREERRKVLDTLQSARGQLDWMIDTAEKLKKALAAAKEEADVEQGKPPEPPQWKNDPDGQEY